MTPVVCCYGLLIILLVIILDFIEYQRRALETAVYPDIGNNFTYPLIGMCGEVGEVADKFKKSIRDFDGVIDDDMRKALIFELGDVLWYLAACCAELDTDLDFIAKCNLNKLGSRRERDVIKGTGDYR